MGHANQLQTEDLDLLVVDPSLLEVEVEVDDELEFRYAWVGGCKLFSKNT